MARLVAFPMPTLAIFNGTAWAGGLIFGLCHDHRIMNANVGSLCLQEMKVGVGLLYPYTKLCAGKLRPEVHLKYQYAITADQAEGLKDGVIDDIYTNESDLRGKITAFLRRYESASKARNVFKSNKEL